MREGKEALKRYDPITGVAGDYSGMATHPDGDYVLFSDIEYLVEQDVKLVERIRVLESQNENLREYVQNLQFEVTEFRVEKESK